MAKDSQRKGSTELVSFLDQKDPYSAEVTKYYISSKGDVEGKEVSFDPFKSRQLEHPVSDNATLVHFLKVALGTGILSMPAAFCASGLIMGIILTIAISIICTHCAYILVECAHDLYRRSKKTKMSFAEVAEEAFLRGPEWGRKYAPFARNFIIVGLFLTYYLCCSCYAVIMSRNFNYVTNYYLGYEYDIRKTLAIAIVPLLLLNYVPNLKYLVPFSMAANIFMLIGIGITFYYIVQSLPPLSDRLLVAPITTMPVFLSITLFGLEAIGVIMPLENNMKTPQHFIGLCGVLNQGMAAITLIYILIGFFGYLKYGSDTQGAITLNLPIESYSAQAVNILVGAAVYVTFGVCSYIYIELVWDPIKHRFQNQLLGNYIVRTILSLTCVILAIAVPSIIPFVSLIGAFCFSLLGLVVPVIIEMLTFWDKGFGKYNWKIFKNIVIVIVSILALIFGSKFAIDDIVAMYASPNNETYVNGTISMLKSLTTFNDSIIEETSTSSLFKESTGSR